MAVTQNTFTQLSTDGNTRSFTFEYLKKSDVKVTVAGTAKTEGNGADQFIFSNATTIQFNTTPATGDFIRIYRETADTNLSATFYAGSAIKSQDLNDNFTQNLYVTQEVRDDSALALSNSREHDGDGTYTSAISKATSALDNSRESNGSGGFNSAISIANSAKTTADDADDNATLALNNSRESDGSGGFNSAISIANTALSNSRESDGSGGFNTAISIANTAKSTATDADTNADTALANSRESDGSGGFNSAISIANTALTNSRESDGSGGFNSAISIANTALTNSRESDGSGGFNTAISIANTAKSTADTSAATVANSAIYQVVANYAALPALSSVDDGKFYQVNDSTSIENNFSSITGEPSNFVGHSGLTVKLKSNTTASPKVWEWQEYYANDPETRYRKKIIVENLNTIDEDYVISANNNAFSVGPVAVAANKTVTINANSLYFIG